MGSLFGIEVRIDFTWIFIFLLITLSLHARFAMDHEDWGAVATWAGALTASLLFFASILLHELGHSVVSTGLGVPVRSITLFVFGGMASLSGEPKRPRDEFLIGAAGPAVSLLLGLGFLLLDFLIPSAGLATQVLGAVCGWLGYINLVLVAFNMIPGFPLDGGHLLRAAVWARTGSRHVATQVASTLGGMFASGLIAVGIVLGLLTGNLLAGLWLVLIGWFILSAARGSATRVVLERALGQVRVREVMTTTPPAVARSDSVREVVEDAVLHRGRRWFVVRDGDETVGLVTLHEIKTVPRAEREVTRIGDIMLPRARLRTIGADATLWTALRALDEARVNQLPVLDEEGVMLGVVTREDVLSVVRARLELGDDARTGYASRR